ncbi:putative carbon catabolite repressor protein [Operophtera brumata]|uniref:Putative carbon catabolite repressor protein n=1 Tax=Operophtera brumata TaxID=104452 RepID=A0A0L7KZR6_OPEBR|nr:putative carbon catabolite repressor protein [Operophtera brumata]
MARSVNCMDMGKRRYFTVTCERLDYKAHVRKLTHLSCRSEKCGLDCIDWEARRQFHSNTMSLSKHSKKAPPNSHQLDQTEKMSESSQPTGNHASYGGSFDVSTEEDSGGNWKRVESSYPSGRDQSCDIPSDFRVWEPVGTQSHSGNGNTFRFKVVSYNVLAQYLLECHPYLYTDCSPTNLKWIVRAPRLYDEIISLEPDILCLQEVQVSHLANFYSKFEKLGYSLIFKQKTGSRQDGCAIYYKRSLFELKDHISVEFYQPDLPILNRDNIGVMVKLAPKGPGPDIVVATTHLLYNPKRTDVRLAQMQVSGHLPVVLTGDFNSLPESAVIKLLDRGHVSFLIGYSASNFRDSSDWERIGVMDNCQHLSVYLNRQQGKETNFTNVKIFNSEYSDSSAGQGLAPPAARTPFSDYFNSGQLGHNLRLTSVYDKYKANGTYEASTFQDYWVTVDYIYYRSVC